MHVRELNAKIVRLMDTVRDMMSPEQALAAEELSRTLGQDIKPGTPLVAVVYVGLALAAYSTLDDASRARFEKEPD
jgi:hypothetical protein